MVSLRVDYVMDCGIIMRSDCAKRVEHVERGCGVSSVMQVHPGLLHM